MAYDATKDVLRCWFIILMAMLAVFLVLGLCKLKSKGDMQVAFLKNTKADKANYDIRGYYDMYANRRTQKGREDVIQRIIVAFAGFDAALINDEKFRNFLINTRNN